MMTSICPTWADTISENVEEKRNYSSRQNVSVSCIGSCENQEVAMSPVVTL